MAEVVGRDDRFSLNPCGLKRRVRFKAPIAPYDGERIFWRQATKNEIEGVGLIGLERRHNDQRVRIASEHA